MSTARISGSIIPHSRVKQPGKAVFISDVHVGSNTFLEECWNSFADWLSDSDHFIPPDSRRSRGRDRYFPGTGTGAHHQEHLRAVRCLWRDDQQNPTPDQDHCFPGNHDVVRGAEPQPVIPEAFTKKFPENCMLVENPALVNLQGVRVLMYHGRSIDDMIGLIPGASYDQSGLMMQEMLQRRHLAPAYGRQDTDCRRKNRPADHRSNTGNPAYRACAYPGADPYRGCSGSMQGPGSPRPRSRSR